MVNDDHGSARGRAVAQVLHHAHHFRGVVFFRTVGVSERINNDELLCVSFAMVSNNSLPIWGGCCSSHVPHTLRSPIGPPAIRSSRPLTAKLGFSCRNVSADCPH